MTIRRGCVSLLLLSELASGIRLRCRCLIALATTLFFYVRIDRGNSVAFTDDGYIFATLEHKGISIAEKRLERVRCLVRSYGVNITNNGEVTLDTEDSYANALNRYVQALLSFNSMNLDVI